MNCPTSEKSTISSNLRSISLLHPQDGAVEIDILAPGQFRVETCAHFQQRTYPPMDLCRAFGRVCHPRKDLQQCAFSGTVAPNDPRTCPWCTSKETFVKPKANWALQHLSDNAARALQSGWKSFHARFGSGMPEAFRSGIFFRYYPRALQDRS